MRTRFPGANVDHGNSGGDQEMTHAEQIPEGMVRHSVMGLVFVAMRTV